MILCGGRVRVSDPWSFTTLACTAGTLGVGSILCVPGIGLIGLGPEAISLMVTYCNRAARGIKIYNPKIGPTSCTAR